ncbi:MAG: 16S ribosomal RNA methyltransferase A [Candidatus Altiarchaeota archaeon]
MDSVRFDQYFMVSDEYLDKICSYASLTKNDVVFEVGAGLGYLTKRIAPQVDKVYAIEKDPHLIPFLKGGLSGSDNVEIICNDALRIDWPKHVKIISNVPYSISRDLTVKALTEGFDLAVFTFQKEFAEKLIIPVGSTRYRFISALAQSLVEIDQLDVIPKEAFEPRPPILSKIVRFGSCKPANQIYVSFVAKLFNQRNKKIRNILDSKVPKKFSDRRPPTLSPEEIIELFSELDS